MFQVSEHQQASLNNKHQQVEEPSEVKYSLDQSEASIQVTWSLLTNQREVEELCKVKYLTRHRKPAFTEVLIGRD